MARGGISFDGIGIQQATFKAGDNLIALVGTVGRDGVVGVPVGITGNGEVDLGSAGETIFGIINVYEMDDHASVTFRGFVTNVPTKATPPTVGKIVAFDEDGTVKDSTTTAKLRNPVFVEVDKVAKTATVFLG